MDIIDFLTERSEYAKDGTYYSEVHDAPKPQEYGVLNNATPEIFLTQIPNRYPDVMNEGILKLYLPEQLVECSGFDDCENSYFLNVKELNTDEEETTTYNLLAADGSVRLPSIYLKKGIYKITYVIDGALLDLDFVNFSLSWEIEVIHTPIILPFSYATVDSESWTYKRIFGNLIDKEHADLTIETRTYAPYKVGGFVAAQGGRLYTILQVERDENEAPRQAYRYSARAQKERYIMRLQEVVNEWGLK